MIFTSVLATALTTSTASSASKSPIELPPVILTIQSVAPLIVCSSSGLFTACLAASTALLSPNPTPIPISASPLSSMIVLTSAKSRLTSPGTLIKSLID